MLKYLAGAVYVFVLILWAYQMIVEERSPRTKPWHEDIWFQTLLAVPWLLAASGPLIVAWIAGAF